MIASRHKHHIHPDHTFREIAVLKQATVAEASCFAGRPSQAEAASGRLKDGSGAEEKSTRPVDKSVGKFVHRIVNSASFLARNLIAQKKSMSNKMGLKAYFGRKSYS